MNLSFLSGVYVPDSVGGGGLTLPDLGCIFAIRVGAFLLTPLADKWCPYPMYGEILFFTDVHCRVTPLLS